MGTVMRADMLRRLAARALENGGRLIGPITVEWDCAKQCESPIPREFSASDDEDRPRNSGHGFRVLLFVPCRNCSKCLWIRSQDWATRASIEVLRANRTWFGTMTLSPEMHYQMFLQAKYAALKRSIILDREPDGVQFVWRVKAINKEITLWQKRIRKNSGATLRFLNVAERHKSGMPHFHCLIHERNGAVRWSELNGQWKLGFSKFKLVDDEKKAPMYVCKYLSKSKEARVRASLRYGKSALDA